MAGLPRTIRSVSPDPVPISVIAVSLAFAPFEALRRASLMAR